MHTALTVILRSLLKINRSMGPPEAVRDIQDHRAGHGIQGRRIGSTRAKFLPRRGTGPEAFIDSFVLIKAAQSDQPLHPEHSTRHFNVRACTPWR